MMLEDFKELVLVLDGKVLIKSEIWEEARGVLRSGSFFFLLIVLNKEFCLALENTFVRPPPLLPPLGVLDALVAVVVVRFVVAVAEFAPVAAVDAFNKVGSVLVLKRFREGLMAGVTAAVRGLVKGLNKNGAPGTPADGGVRFKGERVFELPTFIS